MSPSSNTSSRSLIIILTVSGLVIFILGGIAGIIYQNQKAAGTTGLAGTQTNTPAKLVDNLKSKVISSIVLFGKVEKISGRTLNISNNGDAINVAISNDARFSLVDSSPKAAGPKTAGFENIKVGDTVNMSAKILDSNSFLGLSVVIYPAQKAALAPK